MSENREAWEHLLSQLRERQAFAEGMGGPDRIARQHQRGRLTARERVSSLLDEGSFNEYGSLAGSRR